jgi:hypothetical protein
VGVDVAGTEVGVASAPLSVALRLADDIDVSRGDMFARPEEAPRVASDVEADLVWMSERPLDPDKTYLLKHTTRTVRAAIEVLSGSDPETLQPVAAHALALNDIGRVRVRCRAPIFFDAYRDNRGTGAFIVIDSVTNDTVAAGMIARTSDVARALAGSAESAAASEVRTQVSAHERRERLGQRGTVVRLLAASLDEARDLAFSVERELFDRGFVATVLEGAGATPEAAEACAQGGLIALIPASSEHGPEHGEALVALAFGDRLAAAEAGDLVRRVADALARHSR